MEMFNSQSGAQFRCQDAGGGDQGQNRPAVRRLIHRQRKAQRNALQKPTGWLKAAPEEAASNWPGLAGQR